MPPNRTFFSKQNIELFYILTRKERLDFIAHILNVFTKITYSMFRSSELLRAFAKVLSKKYCLSIVNSLCFIYVFKYRIYVYLRILIVHCKCETKNGVLKWSCVRTSNIAAYQMLYGTHSICHSVGGYMCILRSNT